MNDNERTPPETFLLLKFGGNVYTKDGKEGGFDFDDASADALIAEFNSRSRDLVIDFEHSTLTGGEAPAAGWIDRLEKNSEGLCAHVKYWTDKAKEYLTKGEYRYFSPTLLFGRGGKTPGALHSVALTNHPALHGVDALVANDTQLNPSDPLATAEPSGEAGSDTKGKETPMTEKTETVALTDDQVLSVAREILGLNDATAENVRGKLLALKTQAELVPGLQSRVKELEDAADAEARRLALEDLLKTGRLTNAMAESDHFKNMPLSGLQSYKDATPENSVVPLRKPEEKKRAATPAAPSPILKNLGLTDEEITKLDKED